MLLSNTLREYIKDYELGRSEHSFEEIMDVLELYYINKSLPKYDYEKLTNKLEDIRNKYMKNDNKMIDEIKEEKDER